MATIATLIGFGLTLYAIRDAAKTTKNLESFKDKVDHFTQYMDGYTKRIDEFTLEMRNRVERIIRHLERTAALSRHNADMETATTHINRAMRALESGEERDERIGDFPALLPYLTGRLQNARSLVILQIPFMQFGILGNPRGQREFRQTLYERFREGADTGAELVILTYPDAERQALAARRYNRAPDALRLLFDSALTDQLIERGIDQEISEPLRKAVDSFQYRLTEYQKDRIIALARQQLDKERKDSAFDQKILDVQRITGQSYEEIGDVLFFESLTDALDRRLFERIQAIRATLNETLKQQELRTLFPQHCTIIRINEHFDNRIRLCLNGEELIICQADLSDIEGRDNRVESKMGRSYLIKARNGLEMLLKKADNAASAQATLSKLDSCIETAAARPSLHKMSITIDAIAVMLQPKL